MSGLEARGDTKASEENLGIKDANLGGEDPLLGPKDCRVSCPSCT